MSILVCSYGHTRWETLARTRAVPSAFEQDAFEVIQRHGAYETLAECRNRAAAEARGEWLCFLDSDDRLGVGYIDAARDAYGRSGHLLTGLLVDRWRGCPLLVPAMQFVDEHNQCVGTAEIPAWGRPMTDRNCACIGTLIPRELFEHVGGFREWELYEDWDLWLRCIRAGAVLCPVPAAVYCAAQPTNGSRNLPGQATRQRVYHAIRAEHFAAIGAT